MPGCMEDGSEVEGADTSLGAIIVTAGRGSEQTGWEDGSRPARLVWQWIMPGGCAWRVLIETFFFLVRVVATTKAQIPRFVWRDERMRCDSRLHFQDRYLRLGFIARPRNGMFVRKSLEAEFMHACGSSSNEQK